MIYIRPVSDLRNNYSEIENLVKEDKAVYLTKNGYGSMVVLSLEQYTKLLEDAGTNIAIEKKYGRIDVEKIEDDLDMQIAEAEAEYLTAEQVFGKLRGKINGEKI